MRKLFSELETVKQHSITDFLLDEEASIPKGRLLAIGSLMVVLACMLGVQDAFAAHRSHSSHVSGSGGHSSHSSGYSHGSHASHGSHVSHGSHISGTHSSHASHTSGTHASHTSGGYTHTNHTSHANGYNYHSSVAPSPIIPPSTAPVSPDIPKMPQTLPDTIPPE